METCIFIAVRDEPDYNMPIGRRIQDWHGMPIDPRPWSQRFTSNLSRSRVSRHTLQVGSVVFWSSKGFKFLTPLFTLTTVRSWRGRISIRRWKSKLFNSISIEGGAVEFPPPSCSGHLDYSAVSHPFRSINFLDFRSPTKTRRKVSFQAELKMRTF